MKEQFYGSVETVDSIAKPGIDNMGFLHLSRKPGNEVLRSMANVFKMDTDVVEGDVGIIT